MKIKLLILFILLVNLVIPKENKINETRFEKFWKRTFKKMTFRNPIIYIPYNIKIGYSSFAGPDYWDQWNNILKGDASYNSSPFELLDNEFPNISSNQYREGMSFEIDLLKYNFFHKYQNVVDIHFGVGYKFYETLKAAYYNDIRFKPRSHEININSTFIFQPDPKYFTYLYCSIGPSQTYIYESLIDGTSADGEGINYGFGLGINFITPSSKRNNNLNYGLEIRFDDSKMDKIFEEGQKKINSFHIRKVGLIFSFGIGYGGTQSLGDKAYLNILSGNYNKALEQLNKFQHQNQYPFHDSKIQEMMYTCRREISSELYEKAMNSYYAGDLQGALLLLNQSSFKADDELRFEIENKKYIIADELLDNATRILKNYSIDEQILYFENLKNISENLKKDVDDKIADLFIKKGDINVDRKKYNLAYESYLLSLERKPLNKNVINNRIKDMIIIALNDVYKFLQKKDYVVAYEMLSLISDISRENEFSNFLIKITNQVLSDQKIISIQNRVKKILSRKKQFVISSENRDIFLGDQYQQIVDVLGYPENKFKKSKLNNEYELLIFIIDNVKHKLFFKNKILIDVEREL